MTTANPTLTEQLAERWRAGDHAADGQSDDSIEDAIGVLFDQLAGPYAVYESDDADTPLANEWQRMLEKVMEAAVLRAWDEHIVPAAIAAVINVLPSAPEYLRVHPKSEQLRADLALVPA